MATTNFAVQSSSDVNTARCAYHAFDGVISSNQEANLWHSAKANTAWLLWFNPIAVNLSNVKITNSCTHLGITAGSLQGSNDNTNWTNINTFTNTTTETYAVWDILDNINTYFKYYKLDFTSTAHSGPYYVINEIDLIGKVNI